MSRKDAPTPWSTPPERWEQLKPLANEMRSTPTSAEKHLWRYLRSKGLGVKFRRQHVFHHFIVDFYCSEARLVIEVDGAIHDYKVVEDGARQEFLENLGLRVLRFTNGEVLQNTAAVLQRIGEVLLEQQRS